MKRRAIREHDTLLLNSRLLGQLGEGSWAEDAIEARTSQLIDALLTVWPVPEGHLGPVIDPRDKSRDRTTALPRIEWSEEDLVDYANSAATLTLRLLDHVATERADELLTGADFAALDAISEQVAGATGAMARKVPPSSSDPKALALRRMPH